MVGTSLSAEAVGLAFKSTSGGVEERVRVRRGPHGAVVVRIICTYAMCSYEVLSSSVRVFEPEVGPSDGRIILADVASTNVGGALHDDVDVGRSRAVGRIESAASEAR